MSLVAVVDLDDTLADFSGELRRRFSNKHKLSIEESVSLYGIEQHDFDFFTKLWTIYNSPGFFEELPLLEGAKEAIDTLLEQDINIVIATALPKQFNNSINYWAPGEKIKWVAKHFNRLKYRVTITPDKHLLAANIILEDNIINIIKWRDINPTGVGILIDHLWNRADDMPANIIRTKLQQLP